LKVGVTCDISMEEERIDAPFGVEYFLWLPTPDHAGPSLRSFEISVSVMRDVLSVGEKVYVHCKNGHGCALSMVAAYFIAVDGMSVEVAVGVLKEARPEVCFEDVQIARLEEWARGFNV